MRRPTLTRHAVRCPLDAGTASVTVRSDPSGRPSRRHLDVAACSQLPPTSLVPPERNRYFPDASPPVPYLGEVDSVPRHSPTVACPKPCLAALNAAEPGAASPSRCPSGAADAMELIRRTQSPAITRLVWFHSV